MAAERCWFWCLLYYWIADDAAEPISLSSKVVGPVSTQFLLLSSSKVVGPVSAQFLRLRLVLVLPSSVLRIEDSFSVFLYAFLS
jgi:hypothetical protein